jgi:16S rRNA C967 or C1407 C5-methylase (RsmB/RsmF family)
MDINTHLFYKIKPIPHCIIFDIGAASGSDTYGMKRLIPQATIYSFEPDPRRKRLVRSRKISGRCIV